MLAICGVAVVKRVVGGHGRVASGASRRPPSAGVIPLLFSLAITGALMGDGLGRPPSTPRISTFGPAPSSSQAALGRTPIYPGPSNDAPLPRLNLPITYDYGPGPRHPVPSVPSAPPPALGGNAAPTRPAPVGPTTPAPPVPLPSCS